jgi:hypothetical protein
MGRNRELLIMAKIQYRSLFLNLVSLIPVVLIELMALKQLYMFSSRSRDRILTSPYLIEYVLCLLATSGLLVFFANKLKNSLWVRFTIWLSLVYPFCAIAMICCILSFRTIFTVDGGIFIFISSFVMIPYFASPALVIWSISVILVRGSLRIICKS